MSQSPLLFEVGSRTSSRVCLEYMFFIRGVLDNLPFWPEEKAGTSEASASPSANSSTQPAWPGFRLLLLQIWSCVLFPTSLQPSLVNPQEAWPAPGPGTRMRKLSPPAFQKSSRQRGWEGAGMTREDEHEKQLPETGDPALGPGPWAGQGPALTTIPRLTAHPPRCSDHNGQATSCPPMRRPGHQRTCPLTSVSPLEETGSPVRAGASPSAAPSSTRSGGNKSKEGRKQRARERGFSHRAGWPWSAVAAPTLPASGSPDLGLGTLTRRKGLPVGYSEGP